MFLGERYFRRESLLQELKSPWELTSIELVPEVVELRPSDWPEKYFSGQSERRSSWVTLSPSFTRSFSSSIDLLGQYNGKILRRGEFQKKKDTTNPRKSQAVTRGLGSNTLPAIFTADLLKVYCRFLWLKTTAH